MVCPTNLKGRKGKTGGETAACISKTLEPCWSFGGRQRDRGQGKLAEFEISE